jgi:glyoxylase-like metal-dependent hydrolase (beta-lactamase superfamily II)
VHELLNEIGRKSRRALDHGEWTDRLERILESSPDRHQLCCGHDVLATMELALRKTIASRDAQEVAQARLGLTLGFAFDKDDWDKTGIADALAGWENANAPFRILG